MKIKLLLGGLSALAAVGTISQTALAQSSVGSTTPNTDAVLTVDRSAGSALEGSTTDPLAIRGMIAHTGTPTEVLVMEGEMVRSYPISSVIAGAGSDSLEDNGDGTFTHTDADGNEVTFNGLAPIEPWMKSSDYNTPADAGDSWVILPSTANSAGMILKGNPRIDEFGLLLAARETASSARHAVEFFGAQLEFRTTDDPALDLEPVVVMAESGAIQFNDYGQGTRDTTTPARMLGVNANGWMVEVDPATLGGSGTTSSLTLNADGSYTHSDGAATPVTATFDATNAWHPVSDTTASAVGSTAEDIIFDAGQVGIGVTPSEQLHVAGNALLTGNLYTNSDSRLKTNIVEFEDSLASVMNIEPVTFNWIDEDAHTSGTQLGFIAQDVQAALPEAVIVSEDELGTLSVADRPILAASIGAIQELKAENDALKAELEDMKSQMQQMELLQLAVMSMQAQLADMAQADAMMKANFSL